LGGPSVPILQSYSASELLSDLEDSRSRVLHLLDGLVAEQIRGIQNVSPCLLWEVGHVFFFTEFHYLRYVNISRASILSGADDLYDSSRVPGKIRWTLPLPTLEVTLKYGEDSLQLVRDHWASHGGVGAFAYLLRSATFHEDWHAESFYHTRQKFSYPAPPPAFSIRPRLAVPFNTSLYFRVPGATYSVGASKEISRFVFDNEKPEVRRAKVVWQFSVH
jgi:iron(II)-dependent oxidoreductase